MTTRQVLRVRLAAALACGGLLLAGCGEKIAIPEPVGIFGTNTYTQYGSPLPAPGARHVVMDRGSVYLLTPSTLEWMTTSFDAIGRLEGLDDARAFCIDPLTTRFFVYEAGSRRVRVFARTATDFQELAVNPVPSTVDVTHMAVSPRGTDAVADSATFLYLADAAAGVVHRYACDAAGAMTTYGILARADGQSARFVHVPRGMAADFDDHLLVCDADPMRDWVIRFDPTPDPDDAEEYRGTAAVFPADALCYPEPAPEDYVLGDAAECNNPDWTRGPKDAEGAFHEPVSVAVDGEGGIYVADRLNNRIQKFARTGVYVLAYGDADKSPLPFAIAVGDKDVKPGVFMRGAFMFLLVEGPSGTELRKYLSAEYYAEITRGQPPEIP